jgi:hypothetical protein
MGFGTTVALVSILALVALRPPMPRHSSPWKLQFSLGYLINEHDFGFFHSLRCHAVTDAVESFVNYVHDQP